MKKNMAVEWDYSGEKGPEHWEELCDWFAQAAKFKWQSPISLPHNESLEKLNQTITFHYQKQRFTDKEFKNTIHLVPYDQLSYVELEGQKYYLTDIHFHVPAEHFINGTQEDIEFHFVHMNMHKENLVVGVMYRLTHHKCWLHDSKNHWNLKKHEHWSNPIFFFPEKKSHYHYIGSLTTPPTSGPIKWFVMDQVHELNKDFLIPFKGHYVKPNNRPLQSSKDRKIYYHTGKN
ncbi:carbonic anhydrase family protein [Enterococcus ratti]|uniref:carbonic anhydrase family protein n=1 Tax=Enterococcus ratti TaxID=150033 RepID=UPI003517FD66